MNCSWYFGSPSSTINAAINNAITIGRNGKGSIVFVATGNNNTSITYPASNSDVIAVGASENTDHRASFSNYGTGLDLVAPGQDILTTDIQGSGGYNSSSQVMTLNGNSITLDANYTKFIGTSAATPNAAGVMALILSANPNLSQVQARQITETTADKVVGYTYNANVSNQPNGTWNNEMGYGRVNACLAVIKASILKNVPIQAICTQQWTFGGFPLPAGVSISWTSSNPSGFQIDASGLATRFSNFSGAVTITATVTGGCGTMTISSSVYVGIPDRPGPVTGNTSPNVGYTEFYFSSPPATGATSYDWILPYNSGWSIDHYNDILSIFAIVGSGQGFVQAVSRNACGTGGAAKLYVTPVGNGGCNPCQIVINPNPNPADKDLHVGLGEGKEEKKVSLINSSQETVISLVTSETTIILPTSALPEGVYYLRITRNDQMFEHRIVIKH